MLTKQVEIITSKKNQTHYIKLYDSNGVAYTSQNPRVDNASPTNPTAAGQIYDLVLNGQAKGSVKITNPKALAAAAGNGFSGTKPAFANWMMYSYFLHMETAPFITRLSFENELDIDSIAVWSVPSNNLVDLELRIYKNESEYKSVIYTAEQQALDYPASVTVSTVNPNEQSSFIPPAQVFEKKGTLPLMAKIIRKDGKIYARLKKA